MRALLCQALLGLLVVLQASCGFAPEADPEGNLNGDGIGPWTDLGPVLICLGNEFLGPPASEPGGLCAQSNSTEAPCATNSDCRSRETCTCGRCTVQYCTSNSDCGAGRQCSFAEKRCDRVCARDDDCPLADVCFNGTCRGLCEVDGDCQTGEVCNSTNRCITAACGVDADCLAAERCRIQRVPRLAREPTVLARTRSDEPRFTMWLELSDEVQLDRRSIWRAVSSDGIVFQVDPARPVLEDGPVAGAPSVLRTADGFAIYYEQGNGEAIRYATSADGRSFSPPTTAIAGGAGTLAVHAPSAVVLPNGQVAVYYEVGDGTSIDLVSGELGGTLGAARTVLDPRDVVDPPSGSAASAQFWVDIEAVRSPHVALTHGPAGPSLRMWFSAFGTESGDSYQFGETIPIAPNYSIGYAAAVDANAPAALQLWDFNPVLDRVEVFVDHRSELSPGAVQVSNADGTPRSGYLIYFLDAVTDQARGAIELGRLAVAGNGDYRVE